MIFLCPECNRYGMELDKRYNSLVCTYSNCQKVIQLPPQTQSNLLNHVEAVIKQASPQDSDLNRDQISFCM